MGAQREYQSYTGEFKRDALALITEQGYSAAKAARSLGINGNLIYKWCKDLQDQNMGKTMRLDEHEELIRLRKENQLLRMEQEILRKASKNVMS